MPSRPLVVVSISSREFPEYLLWADMYRGLHQAGVVPVSIDTTVASLPASDILKEADGLILGGGGDVSPFLYGGDPFDPALRGVDMERDLNEVTLLREAIERGIPVLGICRGAQLINVAHGGSLFQDLPRDTATDIEHQGPEEELDRAVHSAQVRADSRLAMLLGASGALRVNSAHHQGIARVGRGLRVVATAPDNAVEAIEATAADTVVFGVQWHPENLWRTEAHARRLLQQFGSLCSSRSRPLAYSDRSGGQHHDDDQETEARPARARLG